MEEEKAVKILLVDDNPNNILSMEVALGPEKYSYVKALSGKEALRILLKDKDFSLILLDVKMPIMDGYETAELIYQRESLQHIPIIFITAQDYEEDSVFKGYKSGAVDFIRKPFNPEVLKAKVGVFVELFRKNQLLKKNKQLLRETNQNLLNLNAELEKRVKERTAALEGLNLELKALNLSKDRILSVISHDLRNPLTSILVSSEFLINKSEMLDGTKIESLAGIINRTSKKMLQQLNDLVDWAMQQREKTRFDPSNLILSEEINEALDLLRSFAHQKQISLVNNIKEDVCVNADEYILRSILQNIITNSIKYTPAGGNPIVINAIKIDKMVEISIVDKGVGMDDTTKSNLFTSSNSKSEMGTNQERGSGLGLLLVKDFVLQHGGEIDVESEIGKGTCFKFSLPLGVNNDDANEEHTIFSPNKKK